MSDEILNQWNVENQTNSQELKERQRDKDFDDIIKMFEKMSPQEQKEFIDNLREKDPVFRWLYNELKTYFDSQLSKLETEEQQRQKPKSSPSKKPETQKSTDNQREIQIEGNNTFSIMETKMTFLKQNKDFKAYIHCFENKQIDGNNSTTLKPEVYTAYSRYGSNKEPLIKILWSVEIQKAYWELQASLKASSNMPYAPQNMDSSKLYAEKQYQQKVDEIIKKYTPITDNFVKLLNTTDIWKTILSNTANNAFDEKLKKDIQRNMSGKEQTDSESQLSNKIEIKTRELIGKIATLQRWLNEELKNYKNGSQEYLKQKDYITWERLPNEMTKTFEGLITKEIDNYAKDIWRELILNNSNVVIDKKVFHLPIWDKEVVLDFSEIWDIKNKSSEQILKLYEKNFSDIYKNTLFSKISRELTSKKWMIDISGIIIAWATTALATKASWWSSIPASAIIFTATENAYRAWMYEWLEIEWWWQWWLWIEENDTSKDIFRKKWFELVSNGVLFWLFRASWWWKEKILHQLWHPNFAEKLPWKLATYGIKTTSEATFFTYYTIVSNNLQENIKNNGNTKEMLDSFTNIWNTNDLIKLFAYNLCFISLVKWWWQIVNFWNLKILQNKLNTELNSLSERWIYFENGRFYKWNNEVPVLLIPEFQRFAQINKDIAELSVVNYRKPESGRAWKTINSNQVDPAKRFQRLERYSSETQTWKISYALNDKTIWETLQTTWFNAGKWVGEWLLKKSWFSNDEISQFKEWKLKWEKPIETKALNEMNKAMEVVYREYKKIEKAYLEWKLAKEISGYSKDITNKIMILIQKETQSYKKEDI